MSCYLFRISDDKVVEFGVEVGSIKQALKQDGIFGSRADAVEHLSLKAEEDEDEDELNPEEVRAQAQALGIEGFDTKRIKTLVKAILNDQLEG